jgi:two-component system, OmpR family, sensor histidine kinase TctE
MAATPHLPSAAPATRTYGAPAAMRSGLQRRLLLLLMAPLGFFVLINLYVDYRAAGDAALQKDAQLARLLPLLADSVLASPKSGNSTPVLLLAPAVQDFIRDRSGSAGFRVSDSAGGFLAGEDWISSVLPTTTQPEFHSEQISGVVYRVAVQRAETAAGELIMQIADGSDARQQWLKSLLVKVLLPNLLLVGVAFFVVKWAVARALQPLLALKDAVARRSPRDLNPIAPLATPAEVQPLVDALNRLFERVNDQAESQRRFVADAAHQLRTPLAGLQAQVEACMGDTDASGVPGAVTLPAETLLRLRSATRRTSQLASQLLALSRADASTLPIALASRIDLKILCETVLPLYLDAAAVKNIDLGLDAEPASAVGDEWLLRELICNLVDNAVKYTPAGGTVTLRCGLAAGALRQVFIEVEDDGPGIAHDERSRVLDRFYRVRGAPGEGNGLGLAIAQEIARAHQGELELHDAGIDARAEAARSGRPGLRIRLRLPA